MYIRPSHQGWSSWHELSWTSVLCTYHRVEAKIICGSNCQLMMEASLWPPFPPAYLFGSLIEGGCVGISRHIVAASSFLKVPGLEIEWLARSAGLRTFMAYRWRLRFCRFLEPLVHRQGMLLPKYSKFGFALPLDAFDTALDDGRSSSNLSSIRNLSRYRGYGFE